MSQKEKRELLLVLLGDRQGSWRERLYHTGTLKTGCCLWSSPPAAALGTAGAGTGFGPGLMWDLWVEGKG